MSNIISIRQSPLTMIENELRLKGVEYTGPDKLTVYGALLALADDVQRTLTMQRNLDPMGRTMIICNAMTRALALGVLVRHRERVTMAEPNAATGDAVVKLVTE